MVASCRYCNIIVDPTMGKLPSWLVCSYKYHRTNRDDMFSYLDQLAAGLGVFAHLSELKIVTKGFPRKF